MSDLDARAPLRAQLEKLHERSAHGTHLEDLEEAARLGAEAVQSQAEARLERETNRANNNADECVEHIERAAAAEARLTALEQANAELRAGYDATTAARVELARFITRLEADLQGLRAQHAQMIEELGCLDNGLCHDPSHVLCCPIAIAAAIRAETP